MMKPARGLMLGFLAVIAIVALLFHENIAHWIHSLAREKRTQPTAATLAQLEDTVSLRYFQTADFEEVHSVPQELHVGDTLRTDRTGRARLNALSGHSLEVQPGSQITFEKQIDGEALVLNLVRGSVQMLQEGQSGKLLVLENGFLYEPGGRTPKEPLRLDSGLALKGTSAAQLPTQPPSDDKAATDENGSLSTDYIVSIIQGQKAFLNRCYATHLQSNPYSKGTMNLSFTIEPSGRVNSVQVLGSSIADTTLQKCVTTVFERARFHAFEAKPIVANYPLVFE